MRADLGWLLKSMQQDENIEKRDTCTGFDSLLTWIFLIHPFKYVLAYFIFMGAFKIEPRYLPTNYDKFQKKNRFLEEKRVGIKVV